MLGHGQAQPVEPGSRALTAQYPMDQAGVLIHADKWTTVTSQSPAKTKTSRGIAASLSYGIVPAKVIAEYAGDHAAAQSDAAQPIICLCHLLSLPGDPVLVKLHPKKGSRELDGGKMIVYPIVGGSKTAEANKSDLISVDVTHPDPQVWLVRPQVPLPPGEYALMLGTQNLSIFPFTIAPPAASANGSN